MKNAALTIGVKAGTILARPEDTILGTLGNGLLSNKVNRS